uniref:Uncharacterized protein n=1 Tax=Eutreptiella gymnastica TaxID=73025 RepID=A0A7S1I1Z4_9EUGL|mmetsp:Transcript_12289/g.22296  ORF Transcript_12289/g.22296 Transcript_12289/m.22296 type:complete len:153 (+) Transcript_12289:63-521(+)
MIYDMVSLDSMSSSELRVTDEDDNIDHDIPTHIQLRKAESLDVGCLSVGSTSDAYELQSIRASEVCDLPSIMASGLQCPGSYSGSQTDLLIEDCDMDDFYSPHPSKPFVGIKPTKADPAPLSKLGEPRLWMVEETGTVCDDLDVMEIVELEM